jgi:ABC-type nitrate/sulfonate/bicarbonate transport system substrate-binding protein
MLAQHGLDPDTDITFVPLQEDYPHIIDRMEEGRFEACLATEPNLSIGAARGVLDIWAAAYEDAYLPDYQWIVRVAHTGFIAEEPELVSAVLRGCQRAAHYAARNIDEFAAFVAQLYGTSEAVARQAMERELSHYQLDCRVDMPGLQCSLDMLHEFGGIAQPRRAEEFTDLRFQPDRSIRP